MGLYQPKALQKLLENLKTAPRRSLSQNFLIDGNIIRKIIDGSGLQAGDHVLEIGPGPGALTEALLQKNVSVIGIEKDDHFYKALKNWNHPSLNLVHRDVLRVDLSSLLKPQSKVVANIPYNITGILLQKLLPLGRLISSLTLMVQKEVAERIIAQKGTGHYSSFTLYVSHYAEPEILFTVNPTSFYPRPKVTSAVIHLKLREPDKSAPYPPLIRQAFQQRRKMLRTSLKSLYPAGAIETALRDMELPETSRPQELSLEEFKQLHRAIHAVK